MIKRSCLIVLVSIMLINCKQGNIGPEEKTISDFVRTQELSGTRIHIENEQLLGRISNMWIYDSLLIAYDYTASNGSFFYAFHKDTYKLLASFGRVGRGPGEGSIAGRAHLDPLSGKIIQQMQDKFLLYGYDLDSALTAGAKYIPAVERRNFKEPFLFSTNSKYYAGSNFGREFNQQDNSIIKVVDKQSGHEIEVGTRFSTPGYANPGANMLFNMGLMVANEEKGRAVYGYVRWKRLAFIDLNAPFKTTFLIHEDEPQPLTDNAGKLTEAMLVGFNHIYSTGDMIFCSPFSTPAMTDGVYMSDNYPNTIQVFDWGGNPIMELKLDSSVSYFALDVKRKRLIGWDPASFSSLVEYDLSQVSDLKLW
jgi:hypothetical protein